MAKRKVGRQPRAPANDLNPTVNVVAQLDKVGSQNKRLIKSLSQLDNKIAYIGQCLVGDIYH